MNSDDYQVSLAALERALARNPGAEIKNHERLRQTPHAHTAAMCRALTALIGGYPGRRIVALIEAELAASGMRSRPEDLVVWIEGQGVLVLEIKSHSIDGIRRFENNIPVVVYRGDEEEDVHLIDQPRRFAYELRAQIEIGFDGSALATPALYWAGWLPNVSPSDVERRGCKTDEDKVWLGDLMNGAGIPGRIERMKNLMHPSRGGDRAALQAFLNLFGCSSGLRFRREARSLTPGTLGYKIDRMNNQLRRLTREQEELAFSPQLLRGPKVIRGVAGSGKTIVLANAIANLLIEAMRRNAEDMVAMMGEPQTPKVLVICYNRALAPYIQKLIQDCFEALKPESNWRFPVKQVAIINYHRLFYQLCNAYSVGEYNPKYGKSGELVEKFCLVALDDVDQYSHVFVDEGQDIEPLWYPFIKGLARHDPELGPSIVVFYDEAQNIYGIRRPGTAGEPSWRDLIGFDVNARGLRTIMRVGHRNTNEILSFSYNMLLGACAEQDPQMAGFAELHSYTQERIPEDPLLGHPNAGRPCVERLGPRRYRVNFALRNGPWPVLHECGDSQAMLRQLAGAIRNQLSPEGEMVDPRDLLVMAADRGGVDAAAEALKLAGLNVFRPLSPPKSEYSKGQSDPRDEPFFQPGRVTVATVHTAKGHTAAICHFAGIERLEHAAASNAISKQQALRSMFHVAATRASYRLEVWGLSCPLMTEAGHVLEFLKHEARETLSESPSVSAAVDESFL